MEEADVLCSKIGIISSGVLRTVGTQVTLKNRYVGGFYLEVGLNPATGTEQAKALIDFLKGLFEKVEPKRRFKTNFIFEVTLGNNQLLSKVF
jgi:hypothetical protein